MSRSDKWGYKGRGETHANANHTKEVDQGWPDQKKKRGEKMTSRVSTAMNFAMVGNNLNSPERVGGKGFVRRKELG